MSGVTAIEEAGVKERRNRALPARLMVYFALALWLDFGKGYVRVLTGLLSGLRGSSWFALRSTGFRALGQAAD